MKYLGQGHSGSLWQSRVCQIKPCNLARSQAATWTAGPAFFLAWGEWAVLAFCPTLPSSSSLSSVVVVGVAYLWASGRDQAEPSGMLSPALASRGPRGAEDGIQGQCSTGLFISRVWTVAPSPLTSVLFRVTNHNNKLIKVNWIKSSKSYLLLN